MSIRPRAFQFRTHAFFWGLGHRVGRLQIIPVVELSDSVIIELFRLFSKLCLLGISEEVTSIFEFSSLRRKYLMIRRSGIHSL